MALPGYGTLNHSESYKTDERKSVLALEPGGIVPVEVSIALNIQPAAMANNAYKYRKWNLHLTHLLV